MPAKKEAGLPSPWEEFLAELDGILHEPLELHCIGGSVFTYFYRTYLSAGIQGIIYQNRFAVIAS